MKGTRLFTENKIYPDLNLPKDYQDPPNPFVQWLKKAAVVLITRIARCWDNTDPAPLFVGGIGFILGGMFTVFAIMMQTHPPSLFVAFLHSTWTGLWLMFLCEAILYGFWEMVQGFKWLGNWAASHHNDIK